MAAPAVVKASSDNIPHIRPMAAPAVVRASADNIAHICQMAAPAVVRVSADYSETTKEWTPWDRAKMFTTGDVHTFGGFAIWTTRDNMT